MFCCSTTNVEQYFKSHLQGLEGCLVQGCGNKHDHNSEFY
jgi:hypothetical protein